jgi:hypothetical protein
MLIFVVAQMSIFNTANRYDLKLFAAIIVQKRTVAILKIRLQTLFATFKKFNLRRNKKTKSIQPKLTA